MARLSTKAQMYIGVAVVLALALAVTFFAIVPLFQEAASVGEQIAAEQQSLSTAEALLARRQSAKAQAAANDVELMDIANQIPDSPQLPSVVIELQDAANAAGVELAEVVPSGPDAVVDDDGEPAGYSAVPVHVVVQGDWADHIDYIARLSKLKRGLRIVDATYVYIEEGDEEPAYVDGSILLEVYVMEAASSGVDATQGQ